ncbi:MAG: CoA-binding protein [Methanomassiliicoccales archaeon]|nr:CoA-binding protein [Methanomassiliicoccales archaeon]
MDLGKLLNPSSLAVVGASAKPEKVGNVILRNLMEGGFRLYPVNPKEKEILGLKCYPDLSSLPEIPDIAILAVSATTSLPITAESARMGIPFVIIVAGGFAEIGPEGGSIQDQMLKAIRGSSTRLLGPNTMGVLIPKARLDTLFLPKERSPRPNPGSIALISQSGSVMVGLYELAEDMHVGMGACVGIGNKADLNENEFLDHFGNDPETKCISLYLESFASGRAFAQSARRISREKPIVAAKVGNTPSAQRAASSHTGALASGTDLMIQGIFHQNGIIRVDDDQELLDISQALSCLDHLKGDRIAIVGSGGGYGVVATDYVTSESHGYGLRMAPLTEATKQSLRKLSPYFASANNPVDLTGDVTDKMYDDVLAVMDKEDNVDAILLILLFEPPGMSIGMVDVAEKWAKNGTKPTVICCTGGGFSRPVLQRLNERGIPAYGSISRSVHALGSLWERGKYLAEFENRGKE